LHTDRQLRPLRTDWLRSASSETASGPTFSLRQVLKAIDKLKEEQE